MIGTSPLRSCLRAASFVATGSWNVVRFTATWITSPTKMAGTMLGGYVVKNTYDKSPLFLGSLDTPEKTDALINRDPFNPFSGPATCPDVSGLFSAVRNCPLPLNPGSQDCYSHGWETSSLGQSSLGQAAQTTAKPIRFAANTAWCFATEKGTMNSLGCAMGFDQAARKQIEEKISLVGVFALLALVWYLTSPRDEENRKKI